MDVSFRKVENDVINRIDQDIKPENCKKKSDWIDIRTEDRKSVMSFFEEDFFSSQILACIEFPEQHPFSSTYEDSIIVNIAISNTTDIYMTRYVSIILKNNLIITIIPQNIDLFNDRNLAAYSQKTYASLRFFIFNILAIKLLSYSNVNMNTARIRLQKIERAMENESQEISSLDLMSCERDINQLSDIIEDQYIGFEILASIATVNLSKESIEQLTKLIKGFEPLDKAMQRLEKKAASLRVQYLLIQQEKATRKINILTIIQAIFVPLTFVAGVYGMNFVIMPELNWHYGYLLVWLVFIGLAAGLLIYFYKKGWFD